MKKEKPQKVKSKHSSKKKLSGEHKAVIVKMLGSFETPTSIVEFLQKTYGIRVSRQNVDQYRDQYPDEIKEVRDKLLDDLELVPVTNKAYRIMLRQKLVYNLMGRLGDEIENTNLWLKEKGATGMVLRKRGNHAIANELLDSIQKELEPQRHEHSSPGGKSISMEIFNKAVKKAYGGD